MGTNWRSARVRPAVGRWISRPSRRAARLIAFGTLAVVGAAVVGAVAIRGPTGTPPLGTPTHDVEPIGLARSDPVRLRIPAVAMDVKVTPLWLDNGALTALPEPNLAGWYEHGTSPGEPGSAVLIGYLRSGSTGPVAFASLDRVAPGDRIEVVRADGRTARFTVDPEVAGSEPGRAGTGLARLRLVGVDPADPEGNPEVVVFATLDA